MRRGLISTATARTNALDGVADGGDGASPGPGLAGRETAYEDDRAGLGHVRRAEPHRVRVAPELVERTLKSVEVHIQEGPPGALPRDGGIDQHVEALVLREERFERGAVQRIDSYEVGAGFLFFRRSEVISRAAARGHLRARGHELSYCREPDAGGATDYDGAFACQVHLASLDFLERAAIARLQHADLG